MEFEAKSTKETAQIAGSFAEQLNRRAPFAVATVVGLYGELGAGKTTFMKFLAGSFGIKETIQSPTFIIMKIYDLTPNPSTPPGRLGRTGCEGEGRKKNEIFDKLIHIDAYRIEKEEEMVNLGWRDIISDPQNLVCVEWPEKIAGIMPPHIVIKFEHAGENERKISIA